MFSLLQRQGWQLLERNWSCRWGKLDLVLHKSKQLLVLEVKGRSSMAWGRWSVDPAKRRRLGRAISCWRDEHPRQADWLLQVAVAVVPLPPAQGAPRWYRLNQLADASLIRLVESRRPRDQHETRVSQGLLKRAIG